MMKNIVLLIQFLLAIIIGTNICHAGEAPKIFTNSIGMKFVLIPSGNFTMGSPADEPGRFSGERQHRVNLTKAFYLQTTEVTQGQWKALMGSNPSSNKGCGDNCPVEQVSWEDAQQFIRKLNQKERTDKYRLPTEAEWEYASRAGSGTAFYNGAITELGCGCDLNLDVAAWYCYNSGNEIHPVAQKKPNNWDLYDMNGNVHEWCQDYFAPYPYDEVKDPKGPPTGTYRAVRGGIWYSPARDCRSASRFGSPPHYRFHHIGFRLCKTP